MWRLREGAAIEPKLCKSTPPAQSRGEAGEERYLGCEMAQQRQNTLGQTPLT